MRKVVLFVTVVCFIFCYRLNAVGQVGNPHYVGPSGVATNGSHLGQTGMNQMCINSYGTFAHICPVNEFFGTAGNPSQALQLWAQPALSNCVYDTTQSAVTCQEAGLSTPLFELATNLFTNCSAWTTATGSGTTVQWTSGTGWMLVIDSDCSAFHRVACCSP